MPDAVQSTLKQWFGHRALRPIQKQIIDRVMQGGHALVVMPTGSGKSLCYQLPALALPDPGVTLVFSPLIALMEDQVAALKSKKIRAEYVNSTLSRRERDRRCRRLAAGDYDLIYATPERMAKPEFTEALDAVPGGVKLLAVDEAHCISRWGHDLRPAYREIGRFHRRLGRPTTIALTATATRPVRAEIRRTLNLATGAMPLFALPIDRSNLSLEIVPVWGDDQKIDHVHRVSRPGGRARGTGIVYFARIMDLERVREAMRPRLGNRPVEIYHGRLPAREKKRVYERFIEATPDEGLMLFATNAFGMGVDKPDIRYIIHAQLPGSVEAYFQEVGRAGRDGRPARCVLLYDPDDLAIQQQFVEWMNPSPTLLARTAHAIEIDPHAAFDVDDLHVMVSGKARGDWRAQIEYAATALEKRGVIEAARPIGRYRFVRPMHRGEIDAEAIERKKQRDLRKLLDIVKMTKCRDVSAFVSRYFDLVEDGERPARRGRRGRRGGRKAKARVAKKTAGRVGGRAPEKKKTTTKKKTASRRGRRRRRRRRGGRDVEGS